MEISLLLAAQLAVIVGGFVLMWRRLDALAREVHSIRRALDALEPRLALWRTQTPAREQRAEPMFAGAVNEAASEQNEVAPPAEETASLSNDPFDDAWVRPDRRTATTPPTRAAQPQTNATPRLRPIEDMVSAAPSLRRRRVATPLGAPSFSPETARAIVAMLALAAPALGLALGSALSAIIATGLALAGALMLISLRASWTQIAWFAALGGGGWALAGQFGIAQGAPAIYCVALVFAGACGLAHARLRRPASPGAALAVFTAAASLTIAAQIGVIGAAGAAFAAIVALAAIAGASTQRLEPLHVAALAAAGAGLFVLSGQDSAAIWYTPAAAWAGAIFLGLAAIRTPALGARGALLAATGTIAPLFAASTLVTAVHGLETPLAAAGAFAVLAALIAGVLALTIHRAKNDVEEVRFPAWILTTGALGAAATAIVLAAPAPFAATCLGGIALGLAWLDRALPNFLWRAAALVTAALTAFAAVQSALIFAVVASPAPALLALLLGLAAPALFLALAALASGRCASKVAALFETLAILGGIVSLSALARLAFADGAPGAAPIGFVEVCAHAALWLAASLALAWRSNRGAQAVRRAGLDLFALAAGAACLAGASFWLTPALAPRLQEPEWAHPPLGFAAPAVLALAHWLFWRRAHLYDRARLAFAIGTLLLAAWGVLELAWFRSSGTSDWLTLALGAGIFALAAGTNFVPGLATPRGAPPLKVRGKSPSTRAAPEAPSAGAARL